MSLSISDPVSTVVGAVAEVGGKLIDRLFPDPAAAAAAKLQLLQMQQTGELAQLTATTDLAKAQITVNQQEAASTNWFVAGGRPFIIWGCGFGLIYASLIEPVARFIATVGFQYHGTFPELDTATTTQVLFGVLGLGAMRTVEKLKGAAGNH